MPPKQPSKLAVRNVALCYIRQSQTRDEDDNNSPKRQRHNIQRVCEQNSWIPEWYEDVGGHRSGTSEDKRPEWLALKRRINDPDVTAVVANDLSRLHRNLAGLSNLIDALEKNNVTLVLAASNNDIDVTTLTGQIYAQIRGLMDAFYAKDVAVKSVDNIEYRKGQGKTIGMPPFGTQRNEEGYLIPSKRGAWLLPDGSFIAGKVDDEPPHEEAVWRGYYECVHQILTRYVEEDIGMQRLSYQMNREGWCFRDRKKRPRPITEDDIRRVLSNWGEYGGLVFDEPAKDRKAYEIEDPDSIAFIEERAVFPLDLLREVARTRKERSIQPVDHGVNQETYPYPLASIVYCAHCEALTQEQDDPRLRTRLGGASSGGKRRYRHKAGVDCGTHNRSVLCHELEYDFGRLIELLTIKPDAADLMIELAIQSDKGFAAEHPNLEEEKKRAIARCRRRIDAAVHLYRDGVISRDEYLADVERNEREIAHWEARTSETEKAALELAMCVDMVEKLEKLWKWGTPDEQQAMARSLFTEIIFDLDTRRIVDFKLKPWADRFLTIRAALYEYDTGENDGDSDNKGNSGGNEGNMDGTTSIYKGKYEDQEQTVTVKGVYTHLPHKPVWGILRLPLVEAFFCTFSSAYNAALSTKNLFAQGFKRKSTIRCVSKLYTMYSNKLCAMLRRSSASAMSHSRATLSITSRQNDNCKATCSRWVVYASQ